MNNLGYIRLYRKILKNPVANKDNDHLIIFLWLLLNATHTKREVMFAGKAVVLMPGQLIVGRKKLSVECRVSESKIYRALNRFESEHLIEQQKSNKNTLITISNWDKYQVVEQQNGQQVNTNRTTSEQQVNTNNNDNNVNNYININNIYEHLEKNYGMFSSAEIVRVNEWIDTYDLILVYYAFKNADDNGVKKLNYIETTLKNWKAEGKTPKDFEKEEDNQLIDLEDLMNGNWLEED